MEGGDEHAEIPQRSPAFVRPAAQEDARTALVEAVARWVPNVMLCRNPYTTSKGQAYGCGQCLPCRLNRRRVWTHRIMLEALQYADNAFVTLTYDDVALPTDQSVAPAHTQLWLKRLRRAIAPRKVRYFLVGEYGDVTERPHYHAALFGYPTCVYGTSSYGRTKTNCCVACDTVRDTWGNGLVSLGTITPHSAGYIAGYVTKKMTGADDVRLKGRHPEFARMSLRPGIAGDATWEIADVHLQWNTDPAVDVPTALRHGGRILPLGRYLTRRLRSQVGREVNAPASVIAQQEAEMLDVRMAALEITSAPGMRRLIRPVMRDLVIRKNLGRIRRVEAMARLRSKRKPL